MKLHWTEIKTILSSLGCLEHLRLKQGASFSETKELEMHLGVALPEEFKNFLSVHNGQENTATGLVFGHQLLSTSGIRLNWDIWRSLDEPASAEDCSSAIHSDPEGSIKPEYTNKGWIPITHDRGGNHIGIDLDPDKNGIIGQIITFGRDIDTKQVLAPNFTVFVSMLRLFLEDAHWKDGCIEGRRMLEIQSMYIFRMVASVGSKNNTESVPALNVLKQMGKLEGKGGILQRKSYPKVNWQKAGLQNAFLYETQLNDSTLHQADLSMATLSFANIENADMRDTTLCSASIDHARLQSADLRHADLRSAWCYSTNLSKADLTGAILHGANLEEVNLEGAQLHEASFDAQTVLPDAKYALDDHGKPIFDGPVKDRYTAASFWSSETDMSRYTNPQHPAFWQPCWAMLGMDSVWEWILAGEPTPWMKAGFGELDHMEWMRAGKP
jgi:cell wall assembly regulator SMI1